MVWVIIQLNWLRFSSHWGPHPSVHVQLFQERRGSAAAMIATAAMVLALAAPGVVQAQTTKAEREDFASQVIGLSMAFYEVRAPCPDLSLIHI